MPRKKFKLAPDAAARRIECENYRLNSGAPFCTVCNHPWCLATGHSPMSCSFREPPKAEAEANG